MLYVVYYHLEETRPCFWFILLFLLFAASQAVLFLASQPLCEVSGYCSDPLKWTDRRYLPCRCDHLCSIPGLKRESHLGLPIDTVGDGCRSDVVRRMERESKCSHVTRGFRDDDTDKAVFCRLDRASPKRNGTSRSTWKNTIVDTSTKITSDVWG
jgi:hypothetical protein